MAQLTAPSWRSTISKRLVLIVITAAAAMLLLASILVTSASAAEPQLVRNVKGDACQALGFGVDAFDVIIPRGDGVANYSATVGLPNGGQLTLSAPPNRSRVDFSMTDATAEAGILFNRTDQKAGNLYDYGPEGGVMEGTLEPPPRDNGNDKLVVFCFAVTPDISIDVTTTGSNADGPYAGPGDGIVIAAGDTVTWTYTVTNTGDVPLTGVAVTDTDVTGISCPATELATGATMTCSASSTAVRSDVGAPFTNTGTATAHYDLDTVSDMDGSSYFGSAPAISVIAKTSGSDEDGMYTGPDDGVFIKTGDTVTWTYAVTNTGNVPLTSVGVTDPDVTGVSCPATELATGATTTCSASSTAERSDIDVFFTNSGTAIGTPAVGAQVSDSDDSSYFGYVATFDVQVELVFDGTSYDPHGPFPVILADEPVTWRFSATNTGNVPVTATIVAEVDGETETTVCTLGDIPPGDIAGNPATCDYDTTADSGESTTSFKVIGTDPNDNLVPKSIDNVGYFGGLDCGDTVRADGPNTVGDGPDVGFYVGPVSDPEQPCGTAVSVTAMLTSDSQVAAIEPPMGYPFIGTGVATIRWDAVERDSDPLVRTVQQVGGGTEVIEQCAEVVGITKSVSGDYELTDPNALYASATDFDGNGTNDGDICLIQQFNFQVDVSGVVYMQLQEVFYVCNDPILSRPR